MPLDTPDPRGESRGVNCSRRPLPFERRCELHLTTVAFSVSPKTLRSPREPGRLSQNHTWTNSSRSPVLCCRPEVMDSLRTKGGRRFFRKLLRNEIRATSSGTRSCKSGTGPVLGDGRSQLQWHQSFGVGMQSRYAISFHLGRLSAQFCCGFVCCLAKPLRHSERFSGCRLLRDS